MTLKFQYLYRISSKEDESKIKKLLRDTFPNETSGGPWSWKYKSNLHFDYSLIAVAEKDGEIVGCNHWLLRNLKISSSLAVKAALGADIAVHHNHRRRGVGSALLRFFRLNGTFKENGVIMTYAFARSELDSRFYRPVIRYVGSRTHTVVYKKFLNCRQLKEKISSINKAVKARKELQARLAKLNITVLFRMRGAPPFVINTTVDGISIEEGESQDSDVIVEGDFPLLTSAIEGEKGTSSLVKALLVGKLRIKGSVWKIFKLYKALKVLRLSLSQ